MFSGKDIDEIVLFVDNEISKYATFFDLEKKEFDSLTNNASYLANERTVSFFANEKIKEYLDSNGYKVALYANEFSIKITNGINRSVFNTLISEVVQSKQSSPWKRCHVDGYFKINHFLTDSDNTHLFVEYKMDNHFIYLDLANDYLKYKAITYSNESGTAFAYVILKKRELYPSIVSPVAPHYELIGKNISSSSVSGTKSVYIYLPPFGLPFSEDERKPITDLENAVKVIRDVTILSDEIEAFRNQAINKLSKEKLIFVNNMKSFNSKVAKSHTLRRYYGFIKELWDKCSEKDFFHNLDEIFIDCQKPLTPEIIIKEGSFYKTNLGNKLTADAKKAAIQNGLRTATNVSLFIVIILDYFNSKFDVGANKPDYGVVPIGRGRNKENIPLRDTVDYYYKVLRENYSFDDGDRRLKKLSYSLMYYIVNLFQIIYQIDETNNQVLGYNEDFQYYIVLDRLQITLNNAMKKLKYKNKKIDVESIFDDEDNEAQQDLLQFVNWIINQY